MTEPTAAPSPREIAASVRKTGRHQLSDREIAGLRDRHEAARLRMVELRHRGPPNDGSSSETALAAIDVEMREIKGLIIEARTAARPMVEAHAAAVAAALAPLRMEQAAIIAAAIAQIDAASKVLGETADEIYRVGGEPVTVPGVDALKDAVAAIGRTGR